MSIFTEFFPTTLYEISSGFSGPIRVLNFRGEKRLMIGGLVQSISLDRPPFAHKVWGWLARFPLAKRKDSSVLILGLGGGTVARILAETLKPKKITGVEIDPVVVEIGQRFFDFKKIRNLQLVVADARESVKKDNSVYDFIVVDTYQGDKFPSSLESKAFLTKLKSLLAQSGVLVFNRIFLSHRPAPRLSFIRRLESVFSKVQEEVVAGPSDAKNYLYWILPGN